MNIKSRKNKNSTNSFQQSFNKSMDQYLIKKIKPLKATKNKINKDSANVITIKDDTSQITQSINKNSYHIHVIEKEENFLVLLLRKIKLLCKNVRQYLVDSFASLRARMKAKKEENEFKEETEIDVKDELKEIKEEIEELEEQEEKKEKDSVEKESILKKILNKINFLSKKSDEVFNDIDEDVLDDELHVEKNLSEKEKQNKVLVYKAKLSDDVKNTILMFNAFLESLPKNYVDEFMNLPNYIEYKRILYKI